MGLDMYLVKAEKPNLQFGIYDASDPVIQNFLLISKEDHDDEMYKYLKDFMTRIQVNEKVFDYEKIKSDYGITGTIHASNYSSKGVVFSGENKNTEAIPLSIVESNYMKHFIKTVFAVNIECIYSWRKAYDVQDAIYNSLDCYIENCGYYPVHNDVANAIAEVDDNFDVNIIEREIEGCIFYHEWY